MAAKAQATITITRSLSTATPDAGAYYELKVFLFLGWQGGGGVFLTPILVPAAGFDTVKSTVIASEKATYEFPFIPANTPVWISARYVGSWTGRADVVSVVPSGWVNDVQLKDGDVTRLDLVCHVQNIN